ncbi:hypothetical protein [Malonomonas rubra]|uniref:hypothetical protein n=1 Tax=Malonomonas rubra TaxID=57040 RepID=UPI0026EF6448|nr:hypothetical protein [Malonomonas rubra]
MLQQKKLPFVILFLLFFLPGCNGSSPKLAQLMKSDIDMVADAHIEQVEALLKELAIKLYKRNPRELEKQPQASLETRLEQLFSSDRALDFAEIEHKRGVEGILLALEPGYQSDRVFPLMVGLITMLRSSYNDLSEFFLLDNLDPQKFYNSARNIEVLVWRLKSRLDAEGQPLLLTNSLAAEEPNLSYERLFGKLIAHQDMMAQIAATKWDRVINQVVQSAATSVFLPVGF